MTTILGKRKNPDDVKSEIYYCYDLPSPPPIELPDDDLFEKLQKGVQSHSFYENDYWPCLQDYNRMCFAIESVTHLLQLVFYPSNENNAKGKAYLVSYESMPCKCIYLGEMWMYNYDDNQKRYFVLKITHKNFLEKGCHGFIEFATGKEIQKNIITTKNDSVQFQSIFYALQQILFYIKNLEIAF